MNKHERDEMALDDALMRHEHGGLRGRMTAALRRVMGQDEERPIEIDSKGNIARRGIRKPRLTILRDGRGEYAFS